MPERGNCYEAAGTLLMDAALHGALAGFGPLELVHGIVSQHGTGARIGHAWLEGALDVIPICIDAESGAWFPRAIYYRAGEIDPAECFRYDYRAFARKVVEYQHWGPWEGPEACAPLPARRTATRARRTSRRAATAGPGR